MLLRARSRRGEVLMISSHRSKKTLSWVHTRQDGQVAQYGLQSLRQQVLIGSLPGEPLDLHPQRLPRHRRHHKRGEAESLLQLR